MIDLQKSICLNCIRKLDFVVEFNKRNMRRVTKAHSGLGSDCSKHKPLRKEFTLITNHQNLAPVWAFSISACRTPYDNKHNARGVEEAARREVNNYHSLVALVQRLQKIKFSECFHSLIDKCTTQWELV